MKTLFLAWQDSESRSWYPVGRLTWDGHTYRFVYTHGAQTARREHNFQPPVPFDSLEKAYESDELFPLFANRAPQRSRADYVGYTECLNLGADDNDPITLLARNGGRRETDSYEVFPCPEPDEDGRYHIHFFAHGLRYLPEHSVNRIERLQVGEQLMMAWDFQNPYDPRALMLRTDGKDKRDRYIVGYCPRYLNADMFQILEPDVARPEVSVERVNGLPARRFSSVFFAI